MFGQGETKEAKDRSVVLVAISVGAVLAVIALIIVVGAFVSRHNPEAEMAQAGSAEFDSYAKNVQVTLVEKSTASTIVGRKLALLKLTIHNSGNRTISGLKLSEAAIGFDDRPLVQHFVTPIPRRHETLAPKETIQEEFQLDPIPDRSEIKDFTVNIYALKLK